MVDNDKFILRELFHAAISSAEPGAALLKYLPDFSDQSITVVGAGKASQAMASALSKECGGLLRGTVVVSDQDKNINCGNIEILEASHPVPDQRGQRAAKKILSLVENLGPSDTVIALVSGGGSSLLPCPPSGMSLRDEIALNEALLKSGVPISAMNAIRKQFSSIKGGRLCATAYPARTLTFIVSDVPGDDPAQVASGPTVADSKSPHDALKLIERYQIKLPQTVIDHIRAARESAPLPDAMEMQNSEVTVIASASMALEAAANCARERGLSPIILSDAIEGEACEVAKVVAAIAKDVSRFGRLAKKPVVILSGGETSVTLRNGGKGGRNTEFLLSFALEIDGWQGITAMAADTDGIDGKGGHAGALACGHTCERIVTAGHDPAQLLTENNSYLAFEAANTLLVTGATGTNVNDFRAVIVR